jgi:hypothetical protein
VLAPGDTLPAATSWLCNRGLMVVLLLPGAHAPAAAGAPVKEGSSCRDGMPLVRLLRRLLDPASSSACAPAVLLAVSRALPEGILLIVRSS